MSKWIPVMERLPASGERVIIARRKEKGQPLMVEQGVLTVNGWWKVYGTNTKAVAYWMPMPSLRPYQADLLERTRQAYRDV